MTIQVSSKAAEVINLVEKALEKTPTGVSFCSIKNYKNEKGEVSDYVFNIGVSYEKAKQKDIKFLNDLDVTTMQWQSSMVDIIKAKQELISSLDKPDAIRSKAQKDAYFHLSFNEDKQSALKVHCETGVLYVFGMKVSKKVIKAIEYKEAKSSPLTIAKNELRKLMKSTKYRQFTFSLDGMSIKASGEEITFEQPNK